VRGLREAVRELEASEARAAVLIGEGSIFCAGLNLVRLSTLDRPTLRQFVGDFMDMNMELLGARLPLVAAINGHAMAGGCILALCCDYRVMARGDHRIGLNEVDLGIRFPVSALEVVTYALPRQVWTEMLLLGRLLDPEDALGNGVVHHIVDSEMLLASARTVAREFATRPTRAIGLIKNDLIAQVRARVEAGREASTEDFLDTWFSDETQARVREVVERLTARK
jgi:enoyl-CoA hydratase/carnithine racemase